jgi:hypothetical protein
VQLQAILKQLATEVGALRAERNREAAPDPPRRENTQRGRGGQQGFQRGGRRGDRTPGDVVCYRCGERGHIKIGCRTNIDHLRYTKDFQNVLGERGVPK